MSLQHTAVAPALHREEIVRWYRRNRARSRALFDLLTPDRESGVDPYYTKPIALRHPIVFYEGHLPAFSFNTLVKKGLGRPSIDERLETLFARGIDPHEAAGPKGPAPQVADVGRVFLDPATVRSGSAPVLSVPAREWPSRDVADRTSG